MGLIGKTLESGSIGRSLPSACSPKGVHKRNPWFGRGGGDLCQPHQRARRIRRPGSGACRGDVGHRDH